MLDCQLKHVITLFLHLQVAVVRVVVIRQHEVFGGVVRLVRPFLQVRYLCFYLLLDVAEVYVAELVVHSKLVL